VTVKDGERAILTRNGRFERVLEPGRHILFDFKHALAVELYQVVRAEFSAPQTSWQRLDKPANFWGLKGSASITGKQATITVVNPHPTQAREALIAIRGGNVRSVRINLLADQDLHAHNTFEQPDVVRAKSAAGATIERNEVRYAFPPVSVAQVTVDLG